MRLVRSILIFILLLCARPALAQQAAPSAIVNQASLSVDNPQSGNPTVITSLPVRAALQFSSPFVVAKQASSPNAIPGTAIAYTIQVTRAAGSVASPVSVTVDGVPKLYYLLSDPILAPAVFRSVDDAGGAAVFFHLRGSPADSYTAALPEDLSKIDLVAAGYTAFPIGTVRTFKFSVRTELNAAGIVANTAAMRFANKDLAPSSVPSNEVRLAVNGSEPLIRYYNPDYTQVISISHLGAPLYVEVVAPSANHDPNAVDEAVIILTSARTGDKQVARVVETGPDTGIFRLADPLPTRDALAYAAASDNGILETIVNDSIAAEFIDTAANQRVSANIIIDPLGVVFDSKTNKPIQGATVKLIDVSTGLPAMVYDYDGKQIPSTIVTGADGRYSFPVLAAGRYQIVVTPPAGYSAPSKVESSKLPAGRRIHAQASYGIAFTVSGPDGAVQYDIPVDPSAASGVGLFIQKSATRQIVEMGEYLDYEVQVKNISGSILSDVAVEDRLPYGFVYQKNTAYVEGDRIDNPNISGAWTIFKVGAIGIDETVKLTYRVRITAGANQGDGTNRAKALDLRQPSFRSNVASVKVEVRQGVFTDDAVIIGKVYADLNKNKIQDDEEPGIPGVRLFLEDGSYAVTDGEGKYSFYGISPRTHVIKLDRTTLPAGAGLEILSSRNAGDPGSRFVDLVNSEMHKADFATLGASEEVLANVALRRAAAEDGLTEIQSNLQAASYGTPSNGVLDVTQSTTTTTDARALPASGVIGVGAVAYQGGVAVAGGAAQSAADVGLANAPTDAAMPRQELAANTPWSGALLRNDSGVGAFVNSSSSGGSRTSGCEEMLKPSRPLAANPLKDTLSRGVSLETIVKSSANARFGFIDLKDRDTLMMTQATVRVQGEAGAVPCWSSTEITPGGTTRTSPRW